MFKKIAIILMVSSAALAHKSLICPQVLIFDLGGIFLNISERGYMFRLGVGTLLGYTFLDRHNPFLLSKVIFDLLERVPLTCDLSFKKTYRHNGEELPYIICAWQAGLLSSSQALDLAHQTITRLSAEGYFSVPRQELLARRTVNTMFNPHIHAQLTFCYKGAFNLLKEISNQRNPDGSKKFRLIALSNWDKDSFESVKKKFAAELAPFDQIIISGDIGVIKPNKGAFDAAVRASGVDKDQCIFIDDQIENVEAGKQFGFGHTILYKNNSFGFRAFRTTLQQIGILPQRAFFGTRKCRR